MPNIPRVSDFDSAESPCMNSDRVALDVIVLAAGGRDCRPQSIGGCYPVEMKTWML